MSKITPHFDFEQALEALKAGRDLSGKDGILTPLIKQLTEAALAAELERHIETEEAPNRKNGSTPKTIKSTSGSFQLETPRDRNGTFEPQLVKKHQTHLTDEIERKILSLFALGSSYADISGHISELYGIDVSSATINAVTDKLIPELKEWQQRPLSNHYPFVWLDAIHYKVKDVDANWILFTHKYNHISGSITFKNFTVYLDNIHPCLISPLTSKYATSIQFLCLLRTLIV